MRCSKLLKFQVITSKQICGALLLLLYYAQVMLGRYIHERRGKLARLGPITHPHPPLNILHIILGVSIITLSFFQVSNTLCQTEHQSLSSQLFFFRFAVEWSGGRLSPVVVRSQIGLYQCGGSG